MLHFFFLFLFFTNFLSHSTHASTQTYSSSRDFLTSETIPLIKLLRETRSKHCITIQLFVTAQVKNPEKRVHVTTTSPQTLEFRFDCSYKHKTPLEDQNINLLHKISCPDSHIFTSSTPDGIYDPESNSYTYAFLTQKTSLE